MGRMRLTPLTVIAALIFVCVLLVTLKIFDAI